MNKSNLLHRVFKRNIIPSAHSMDTSFYAFHEGTLVEFQTRESGIVPEGYPTIDEVDGKMDEIIRDCQDVPCVKQRLAEMGRDYFIRIRDELISCISPEIVRNFAYIYYSQKSSGPVNLLRGEIDESWNVYRYVLSEEPDLRTSPAKIIERIRSKLSNMLPEISLESSILFNQSEVASTFYLNPDLNLIERAIKAVGLKKEEFFKIARAEIGKTSFVRGGIALVNLRKMSNGQRTAILLSHPQSAQIFKEKKLILTSFQPYYWYIEPGVKEQWEIARQIGKVNPEAVLFSGGTTKLVELLRKIYQNKESGKRHPKTVSKNP